MNIPEFRAAIAKSGETNRALASQINLSEQAFYNKLNGKSEFKNSEIKRLAQLLGLSMSEVNIIFFDNCVILNHAKRM